MGARMFSSVDIDAAIANPGPLSASSDWRSWKRAKSTCGQQAAEKHDNRMRLHLDAPLLCAILTTRTCNTCRRAYSFRRRAVLLRLMEYDISRYALRTDSLLAVIARNPAAALVSPTY